jgi:hypothetical protein
MLSTSSCVINSQIQPYVAKAQLLLADGLFESGLFNSALTSYRRLVKSVEY